MRLVTLIVNLICALIVFLSFDSLHTANAEELEPAEDNSGEHVDSKESEHKKFEAEFCLNLTLLTSLEMNPHVTDDYVHFSPGICAELMWFQRHIVVIGAAVTLEEKPIPMPYLEYEYRSPTNWFLLGEFRSAYDLGPEGLSLNGYLVAGWQHDIIELGGGASTWRVGEQQAVGPMVYLRASPRKWIEMRFYAAPGVTASKEPMFHMMGGAAVTVKVGEHARRHKDKT